MSPNPNPPIESVALLYGLVRREYESARKKRDLIQEELTELNRTRAEIIKRRDDAELSLRDYRERVLKVATKLRSLSVLTVVEVKADEPSHNTLPPVPPLSLDDPWFDQEPVDTTEQE